MNTTRPQRGRGRRREKREFDQELLDLARVTRVVAGGRRFGFRAAVAIGNRKGRVGFGIAKGRDVSLAVEKAVHQAKKSMIDVPVTNGTIPHDIKIKKGSAFLQMRPGKEGAGIIAGGAVRVLCDLAGIRNVTAKMYGTNSKINNAYATLEAFSQLEGKRAVLRRRGLKFEDHVEKPRAEVLSTEQKKDTAKKPATKKRATAKTATKATAAAKKSTKK